MNFFLGVSKSVTRLSLNIGDGSYWCIYKENNARIGDYLLLYYSSIGIKQLYLLTNTSVSPEELSCEVKYMKTIKIQLKYIFDSPLTHKQLIIHPILKKLVSSSRNFQGTIFNIKPDEWVLIKEILEQTNLDLIINPK